MSIFLNVILGIVLGLDAFSLFVSLGSFGYSIGKSKCLLLLIGLFHFIFPIIGSLLGTFIKIPITELKILVYFFLIIELFLDYFNSNSLKIIDTFYNYLLLAFSVSIDSFSIGISLVLNYKIIVSGSIFSILAMTFSVSGLYVGRCLYRNIGRTSKIIGIVLMVIVLLCQIMSA